MQEEMAQSSQQNDEIAHVMAIVKQVLRAGGNVANLGKAIDEFR